MLGAVRNGSLPRSLFTHLLDLYGSSTALIIHSLDPSLSTQLITYRVKRKLELQIQILNLHKDRNRVFGSRFLNYG